jgi:outer membrane protein assembly factor BamB
MDTIVRRLGPLACGLLASAAALCAPTALWAAGAAPLAVTTYHYNNRRTGWNNEETVLTAAGFPASFGVLATVPLDDQVDAQPLLVPHETIAGGVHDVVYVVTESNSVYAIDANSGQVLLSTNLGPPVPTPLGCGNNGPNVGIDGTPVIDLTRQRLYVVAYLNGMPPTYQLHALNLTTLTDAVAPVTVTASHTLTDGSTFTFDATYQRQRPALLEFDGNIYAGFGSFCDFDANDSRGWVLGWGAQKLKPLANNQLNDTQASSATDFFLTSVWMSGYGLASNGKDLFFATGNSDCNFYVSPEACPSATTYDGVTHVQESVIGVQPNLAARTGVFTPANVYQMDIDDADLGASGVLLLPEQADGAELAAIVSKDGRLWLLDQTSLGSALGMTQLNSGCWCGATYFVGSDGVPRVVTGAGVLQTWTVSTTPTPQLNAESTTSTIAPSEQDPGFFTTVSSDQRRKGSAIIWAVGRPSTSPPVLTLYAFSATVANGTLPLLYSAPAGSWPNLGGNANVVPVVANGKVYVAGYQTLTIFGPNGTAPAAAVISVSDHLAASLSRVTGTLLSVHGSQLTLATRSGATLAVDATRAVVNQRAAGLVLGQAYTAIGPRRTQTDAAWSVTAVSRAKPGQGAWPSDQ